MSSGSNYSGASSIFSVAAVAEQNVPPGGERGVDSPVLLEEPSG